MGGSNQKARFAVGGKNPENTEKRQRWVDILWPEILAKASKKKLIFYLEMKLHFHNGGHSREQRLKKGNSPALKHQGLEKVIKSLV